MTVKPNAPNSTYNNLWAQKVLQIRENITMREVVLGPFFNTKKEPAIRLSSTTRHMYSRGDGASVIAEQ